VAASPVRGGGASAPTGGSQVRLAVAVGGREIVRRSVSIRFRCEKRDSGLYTAGIAFRVTDYRLP
jgi:hypothetical protein